MQVEEKINRMNSFKDKNILVVGLARSGTGAANLLSELGAQVSVTDRKPRSALEDQIKKLSSSVTVISGSTPDEMVDSYDMIVVSPGVPLNVPLLVRAGIKGIPVIGELELAYQAITSGGRDQSPGSVSAAGPAFIGVTGTNGKSTTTTLIDLMLKESGYNSLLGGNIGNALTEEIIRAGVSSHVSHADTNRPDFIVAEISSFQLESIDQFEPGIAALLNITPDHLDRYDAMDDYMKAKARIFENQTSEDYLVINADDPLVMKMIHEKLEERKERSPKVLYFSRKREVEGIYMKDGMAWCNYRGVLPYALIAGEGIKMKGVHNLENAMAASLVALLAGATQEAVKHTLQDFPGLEHRLEFVDEIQGVQFINDSKGTNVGAVAKSLEDFENIILIMGGMDKGNDYSVLRDLIKRKVKLLILIGAAKEIIEQSVGAVTEVKKVDNLRDAVALAMSKARAGDVVMLSPGCASFDMFADFEDRGRKFKQVVRDIAREQ
jgi:UDP-N-acetylmuramoylalanine--D-glutamate ligase